MTSPAGSDGGHGPAPAIVHDVLRLFLAAGDPTPRGIDRVDFAYVRFLCDEWPGPFHGVLPTPLGPRLIDRARIKGGLQALRALWREDIDPATDPTFIYVRDRLLAPQTSAQAAQAPAPQAPATQGPATPARAAFARFRELGQHAGLSLGGDALCHAPRGALYLNVGQIGWAAPMTTLWLARRPDIRPVFMLHDTIPVENRELVSFLGHWTHRMMLQTVARRGAALISTTENAAVAVQTALARRGRGAMPCFRAPLPVSSAFLAPPPPDPALARRPYFLVCGAIEPRKNLALLLDVWRTLAPDFVGPAPALVVAGALARRGEEILPRLRAGGPDIIVATALSTPALRQLMAHARALLMPSLAEGFGLPIIEALTLGTPVLASALPAHREAGGEFPLYLDPCDPAAWRAEILRLASDPQHHAALQQRLRAYKPLTEARYFASAGRFLRDLAQHAASGA